MAGAPRILAIDDEAGVLNLLKTILGRLGYEVTTTESSKVAMGLLEKSQYDCVITDAVMPEISGYDLVKHLRAHPRYANLPILMLTRKRHRQDVKNAVEAGVTDYVLKPLDESLLLEKVEHYLKNNGKEGTREIILSGSASHAEVSVGCALASLGENTLTLRLHYRLETEVPFRLQSPIFGEIGISQPTFKLESCEMKISEESPSLGWEAKLSFALPEADAVRLRTWLQRQKKTH